MKLKEYIDKYGMKQSILARRSGISENTLIRAIRGEYIRLSTAAKIAKATENEVTVYDICSTVLCIDENSDKPKKKKDKEKTRKTK